MSEGLWASVVVVIGGSFTVLLGWYLKNGAIIRGPKGDKGDRGDTDMRIWEGLRKDNTILREEVRALKEEVHKLNKTVDELKNKNYDALNELRLSKSIEKDLLEEKQQLAEEVARLKEILKAKN